VAAAALTRASAAGMTHGHPYWVAALETLRDALGGAKETVAAVAAAKRTVASLRVCYSDTSHSVAVALMALVEAQVEDVKAKDHKGATAYLRTEITWIERQQQVRRDTAARTAVLESAVLHAINAEEILEETEGRTSLTFIMALGQRAEVLSMLARHTDALRAQAEALRTCDLEFGHSHEYTLREAAVLTLLTQRAKETSISDSDKNAVAAAAEEVVREVLEAPVHRSPGRPRNPHATRADSRDGVVTPDFVDHLPCSLQDCLSVETEAAPFAVVHGERAYCSIECQMNDFSGDLDDGVNSELVTGHYPRPYVKDDALDVYISKRHAALGHRVKSLAVWRCRRGAYLLHRKGVRSLYIVVDEISGVLIRVRTGWAMLDTYASQFMGRASLGATSPQMIMCAEIKAFLSERFAVISALQYE
jgi:hypothetical protein